MLGVPNLLTFTQLSLEIQDPVCTWPIVELHIPYCCYACQADTHMQLTMITDAGLQILMFQTMGPSDRVKLVVSLF